VPTSGKESGVIFGRRKKGEQQMTNVDGPPWYWSLTHSRVEGPEGDPNDQRLGPYQTREEAERALEIARRRTEEWDEAERRYNEGD
jgi:hypothetical protein